MLSNVKYLLIGATAAIALLVVANVEGESQPRADAISQQTSNYDRPSSFETNAIYGSDAGDSTFGLDTTHRTDW